VHVVDEHELPRLVGDFLEPRFEKLGVVVLRLEVDPENGTTVALGPLGQQRGLTESRRRDEGDDRAVCDPAEAIQQCGAHHGLTGRPGCDRTFRRRRVRARQRFRDGHINKTAGERAAGQGRRPVAGV
jgi:hypothetical protein